MCERLPVLSHPIPFLPVPLSHVSSRPVLFFPVPSYPVPSRPLLYRTSVVGGGRGGMRGVAHANCFEVTSGRGGFEWVMLRRCVQNCLAASNLLCQYQSQTQIPVRILVRKGLGTQYPQIIQEYYLTTIPSTEK